MLRKFQDHALPKKIGTRVINRNCSACHFPFNFVSDTLSCEGFHLLSKKRRAPPFLPGLSLKRPTHCFGHGQGHAQPPGTLGKPLQPNQGGKFFQQNTEGPATLFACSCQEAGSCFDTPQLVENISPALLCMYHTPCSAAPHRATNFFNGCLEIPVGRFQHLPQPKAGSI